MGSINLFFETFADPIIRNHVIIRLKAGIQFKILKGWSKPYSGIIDTGAHITAIPSSIWKNLTFIEKSGNYGLFGLSKNKECVLHGELAKISVILVDESGNQTNEFILTAFLAETDHIPLILGFNGLLEKMSLYVDYKRRAAYVEE